MWGLIPPPMALGRPLAASMNRQNTVGVMLHELPSSIIKVKGFLLAPLLFFSTSSDTFEVLSCRVRSLAILKPPCWRLPQGVITLRIVLGTQFFSLSWPSPHARQRRCFQQLQPPFYCNACPLTHPWSKLLAHGAQSTPELEEMIVRHCHCCQQYLWWLIMQQ